MTADAAWEALNAALHEQFAAHQACHEVMTEALGTDQTFGALTGLHNANPEGYRALAVARAI